MNLIEFHSTIKGADDNVIAFNRVRDYREEGQEDVSGVELRLTTGAHTRIPGMTAEAFQIAVVTANLQGSHLRLEDDNQLTAQPGRLQRLVLAI